MFKKGSAVFCLFALILGSFQPVCLAQANNETEVLLERVQKLAFDFFWQEANPSNGLVKDRAGNFEDDSYVVASVASVGFALAALPIAVERKWISKNEAKARAVTSLSFFADKAEHVNGFFYHFLGMNTGKRMWKCELSSIDSALLLAGAIVAREYFQDPEVTRLVNKIYDRTDFEWMMNGGRTLTMGWKPESGFIKHRWSEYNEGILLTLLAMGAKTYPVPPETWNMIRRKKGEYGKIAVIQSPPLFTHQYPHLFFDFRGKHDKYADYFENSKNATLTNLKFTQKEALKHKAYQEGYWGLTASDGPKGYKAYGAEPGGAVSDGTIAPTGAITSIMFTPELSIQFLKDLYAKERDWLWGRYGFTDAFNLKPHWRSPDVIGIDQGGILLGIENYRTGLVWSLFSKAPEVQRALELARFSPGSQKIAVPYSPLYPVKRIRASPDWKLVREINLTDLKYLERGESDSDEDLSAKVQFLWDQEYLYFYLRVRDDSVMSPKGGEHIWLNDCFEIFIDPSSEGFQWGETSFYQIGFSPNPKLDGLKAWSWIKREDPIKKRWISVEMRPDSHGYVMEGKIRWDYLKIKPVAGTTFSLSPAIHDADDDNSESKYNWHFDSHEGRFELGKLKLI